MKAVIVRGYGDVNQLVYGDTPDLKPGPGEVLVRMSAISINPIDWKLRRGDLKALMPLNRMKPSNKNELKGKTHAMNGAIINGYLGPALCG